MKKVSKNILNYTAIIEQDEKSGFWAYVPSLEGCYTQGETLDEVTKNLKEAIELYLEVVPVKNVSIRKVSPFAVIQVPVFA